MSPLSDGENPHFAQLMAPGDTPTLAGAADKELHHSQ